MDVESREGVARKEEQGGCMRVSISTKGKYLVCHAQTFLHLALDILFTSAHNPPRSSDNGETEGKCNSERSDIGSVN